MRDCLNDTSSCQLARFEDNRFVFVYQLDVAIFSLVRSITRIDTDSPVPFVPVGSDARFSNRVSSIPSRYTPGVCTSSVYSATHLHSLSPAIMSTQVTDQQQGSGSFFSAFTSFFVPT
jgi:hypothetical protein